ncbi:laminin subunit gamma-1-like isoform X1 [Euwallacea fornicatus]|uniref:laminin subunit gamma-1-like isoform X1 n=1 Tax=Euwallacea fornicatus TaxID=995702 RepID=UPI00338F00A1
MMSFLCWVLWTFVPIFSATELHEFDHTPVIGGKELSKCYDRFNIPQRCIPEFENAAFDLLVEVTNTCGDEGPQEYCVQTGISGVRKSQCAVCNPEDYHAVYLTDFHNVNNLTWWQSETMLEGIQWPNQVNLTLKFGKAFDITYVRLWFNSPRPESFYISKKTEEKGEWIPYQYYSATCRDTYALPDSTHTKRGEETRALCTSEYSDISPLRGGNVAFGTLEGRPSAYNFDSSPELQEWVTATEIMITLDRLNTFGDEVFGDPQVLRSYFYAIADIAVGARCKCNGHASECVTSYGESEKRTRVCRCEHNTAGPDCGECLPFYNDAPWARATILNAHECKECNCNGYSTRCMFDTKLYEITGHGGHCLDCSANRDGPNCERCRPNYYMRDDGYCTACNCDEVGSLFQQCNFEGKCQCKTGVTGEKCDRCAENHYDFSKSGCKNCGCWTAGSAFNTARCNPSTGVCQCKENVEGRQCKECKPGFFNLDSDNEFGCTPCFCYGHSSECKSAPGYFRYLIESTFARGPEKWKSEDEHHRPHQIKYEAISQSIGVQSDGDESIYLIAPDRFLGDQRTAYNQLLDFSLRLGDGRAVPTATDVILESGNLSITNTIFAQGNKVPTVETQNYKFRLHEHPDYGWQPRLTSRSFISLLSNLTMIKVKGTYAPKGVGFLDDFKLETASRGVAGKAALWIELCSCPTGYVGQFCESCEPGYRHIPAMGGPFMNCIPCDCNNHASICDSETGKCICQHNTSGENCELCTRGFYGNALAGTSTDCQPCGCPDGGACIQIGDNITMCTECPLGYSGFKCDVCSDGFYGDPTGKFGEPTICQQCACNQNIDLNAIGNCNTTTGECLRCIYNTAGSRCEACLPGFFGNALVLPKGDCKKCQCYSPGTDDLDGEPICDQTTGACQCKNHVIGTNCDKCESGYFNILSSEGCQSCNCDPIGSFNQSCDLYTGQCFCRLGVTGLRCDHCEARKYGFSIDGCKECECDRIGSRDLQCDASGQCPCLDNVEGRKCDRCKENKYNRQKGCIDCPDCYNLVQDAYKNHSSKLDRLNEILNEVENQPTVIDDEEFPDELGKLEIEIDEFHDQVKASTGENSVFEEVLSMLEREKDVGRTLEEIYENVFTTNEKSKKAEHDLDHAEEFLIEVEERLIEIEDNFELQAKKAYEAALERSKAVGQQSDKMTGIAQQARELADILDERAEALVGQAKDAKNKSIETYEQIKSTHALQQNISDAARSLNSEVANAEFKLNRTREWTEHVQEEAVEVKEKALALLNEVTHLIIPQIKIPELKAHSGNLKDEAIRLTNKSKELFHNAKVLKETIEEKQSTGQELLDTALEQQEEVEDLKNDVDFSSAQTAQAIQLWKEIHERAQGNFQLLTAFDSQTQESKQRAEESLKTISNIEIILQDTNLKTNEAQQILEDAQENADLAFEKAKNANDLAKNASAKTEKIKSEAEDLNTNSTFLRDEAGFMYDRVFNTEAELKNLWEKARSNNTLVHDAKEKVGRAGKDTDAVQTRVTDLLNDVESILVELEDTPDISDDELDRLEQELLITEARLKETRLEERLEELQKQHKNQNQLIESYKEQIRILQADVNNIEQIVNTLPEGCFKRMELEP